LALKQSIEDIDPNNVLLHTGRYVDIGPFEEIVYGHDLSNDFEIGLKWKSSTLTRFISRSRGMFKIFNTRLIYSTHEIDKRSYIKLDEIN